MGAFACSCKVAMEPATSVKEATDAELSALPIGSSTDDDGGRQQALYEIAGLSHKVSRQNYHSPFSKVPLVIILIVLLAVIVYHMSALVLKEGRTLQRSEAGLAGLLSVSTGGVDATKEKQAGLTGYPDAIAATEQSQKVEDAQQPAAQPPSAPLVDSASVVPTESASEELPFAEKPKHTSEDGTTSRRDSLSSEDRAEISESAEVVRKSLTSVSSGEEPTKPEDIEDKEEVEYVVYGTPITSSSEGRAREFNDDDMTDAEASEKEGFSKKKVIPGVFDKERLKGSVTSSSLEGETSALDFEEDEEGYEASDEASGDEEQELSSLNTDEMQSVSEGEPYEEEDEETRRAQEKLQRYKEVRWMVLGEADRLHGSLQWKGHIPVGENDWSDDDVFED